MTSRILQLVIYLADPRHYNAPLILPEANQLKLIYVEDKRSVHKQVTNNTNTYRSIYPWFIWYMLKAISLS